MKFIFVPTAIFFIVLGFKICKRKVFIINFKFIICLFSFIVFQSVFRSFQNILLNKNDVMSLNFWHLSGNILFIIIIIFYIIQYYGAIYIFNITAKLLYSNLIEILNKNHIEYEKNSTKIKLKISDIVIRIYFQDAIRFAIIKINGNRKEISKIKYLFNDLKKNLSNLSIAKISFFGILIFLFGIFSLLYIFMAC